MQILADKWLTNFEKIQLRDTVWQAFFIAVCAIHFVNNQAQLGAEGIEMATVQIMMILILFI